MTLQSAGARVWLCGELRVQLDGNDVRRALPARQGRLLFAYLVLHRDRVVRRDELAEALWPEAAPRDPDAAVNSLLARLRPVVGRERLPARGAVRLHLGERAWVDVEAAQAAPADARRLLDDGRAADALRLCEEALGIIEQPLLAEFERRWLDERRSRLADLLAPLVEVVVDLSLTLGGAALQRVEPLARRVVEREPYRESAHESLMKVLAARGDTAEALRVFEDLRVRLRDELGVSPRALCAACTSACSPRSPLRLLASPHRRLVRRARPSRAPGRRRRSSSGGPAWSAAPRCRRRRQR